jgi:hypothetical protein
MGKYLRAFFGLACIPASMVPRTFEEIKSNCPADIQKKIQPFIQYIADTYIYCSDFPPSLWAAVPSETPKTTNGAEGFHSNYNKQFFSSHPSSYSVIRELKVQQARVYVKINTALLGVPGKRNVKCLEKVEKAVELWNQVMFPKTENGRVYLFDYLVRMSYNYDTFSDVAKEYYDKLPESRPKQKEGLVHTPECPVNCCLLFCQQSK